MWLIIILTLLNGAVNNKTFVLEYRINAFGVPFNTFDALLAIALVGLLFNVKSSRFPADRVHPALKWILGLFTLGTLGGFLGSLSNGADLREITTIARNYLAMPLCVILGYGYLNRPQQAIHFAFAHVVSGVITALMILIFFVGQTELSSAANNVNILRTVDYIAAYAGTAALFLTFTFISNVQFLPRLITLPIAGFALVGQFATLSRSEWVATVAGAFATPFLLPRAGRWMAMLKAGVVIGTMLVMLVIGVELGSRAAGWDFAAKVEKKFVSMLPGSRDGDTLEDRGKAWDSRVPGAIRELEIWTEHPLFGAGFGAQAHEERVEGTEKGFYHNAWTSTLCHAGPAGLAAMLMTVATCFVIGRRMVLEHVDRPSMLFGALAAHSGLFFFVYGLSTLSFNTLRGAIPLGLLCGMTLRARAMQLTIARQYADYLPPLSQESGSFEPMLDAAWPASPGYH